MLKLENGFIHSKWVAYELVNMLSHYCPSGAANDLWPHKETTRDRLSHKEVRAGESHRKPSRPPRGSQPPRGSPEGEEDRRLPFHNLGISSPPLSPPLGFNSRAGECQVNGVVNRVNCRRYCFKKQEGGGQLQQQGRLGPRWEGCQASRLTRPLACTNEALLPL